MQVVNHTNEKNTNSPMKNFILALTILIASSTYGQVGEKNFIDQNFIEVVGKYEMEITPDEIFLKIIINEKDIKGKTLAEIEKSLIESTPKSMSNFHQTKINIKR
jgi:hypothetical protein